MCGRNGSSTNVPIPLDSIFCLDFEASAVGPGSYPIEVAVVDCATAERTSWLIQPIEAWLKTGIWSDQSAAVHKVSRKELKTRGEAAEKVAQALAEGCSGKTVLCDGG
jgi:hypothetical protein